MISLLGTGCETTQSGSAEITGKTRKALSEWDVDIYQKPAGLLPWVIDMDIPAKFEEIAKLEAGGTATSSQHSAIDDKTSQIVSDLKRQAARLGANAIIVTSVSIVEDYVEYDNSRYENVRYPDGSIGQVEVQRQPTYSKVFKITIAADAVFLDWNTVWSTNTSLDSDS